MGSIGRRCEVSPRRRGGSVAQTSHDYPGPSRTAQTKERPVGAALDECELETAVTRDSLRSSDGRPRGRAAIGRAGFGRYRPRTQCSCLVPPDSRAERKGHRRQERQRHGEARQDRLHNTTSNWVGLDRMATGNRAVFGRRSLALRPRLATGLPWTVGSSVSERRSHRYVGSRVPKGPYTGSTSPGHPVGSV
jgi:hypothetical protein